MEEEKDTCPVCCEIYVKWNVAILCPKMHTCCWSCYHDVAVRQRAGPLCCICRTRMFDPMMNPFPSTLPPPPPPAVIPDIARIRKRRRTQAEVVDSLRTKYPDDAAFQYALRVRTFKNKRSRLRRRLHRAPDMASRTMVQSDINRMERPERLHNAA
jgi:hypothetical protein